MRWKLSNSVIEYSNLLTPFNKMFSFIGSFNRKWLILFITLNLLIVVPELSLRLLNFNYGPGVSYGNLVPKFTKYFVPDEKLMWKYSSNDPGVNSYGFYGPEVILPKPANTVRILFFGDSCAEQDYASFLEDKLNKNKSNPDIKFECLIFAIAGYSSFQGRVLVENYAKTFEADLAVICYGWNDHWLSYCNKDDQQFISKKKHFLNKITYHSKILQLARKLSAPLFRAERDNFSNTVRVPINKYRDNICYIINTLKFSGTKSVLLTAPTTFYNNGVSDYIINSKLAVDKNSAILKHREYNEVIRKIATTQRKYLLDMEKIVNRFNTPDSLFLKDGIHFSSSGLNYMASLIYLYLRENRLI